MKTQKELQEARRLVYVVDELRKIARAVHNLDETECNYGKTERQEKRLAKLLAKATESAAAIGFELYHQGDPRGASLWLVVPDIKSHGSYHTHYTEGIALY